MPIPGSNLELLFDIDAASELMADVFPSSATYLAPTKTQDTTGQEQHTFSALGDPAYSDIACRRTPQILIRPQDQESGSRNLPNQSDARYHLTMLGSFPLMSIEGQLVVDGVTYEIKAIDTDGNSLTTRVMLGREIPFNA